ncbi:MAG: molybdate ABC transporter substrate-binding protein [Spirochaetales bacterium]|nr:molybdate ABC transporter substrate-binding protein [Spirochaetales bacterium]
MKQLGILTSIICSIILTNCNTEEASFMIASGAGYKNPMNEIKQLYMQETGIKINMLFGNMQTISQQTLKSGQITIVIGDMDFLQNPKYGVKYSKFGTIGCGKLALAFGKNNGFSQRIDLLDSKIKRVLIADPENAIYGKAAKEYLQNIKIWSSLQDKLLVMKTVPMVSSYLLTNEADAGFINLSEAISLKDKLKSSLILSELYSPIKIVAGVVDGFETNIQVNNFLTYLVENIGAKKVFESYGL